MLDSIQSPNQIRENPPPKKNRFRFWFALVMLALLLGGIFVGSKLVIIAQKVFEGTGRNFSFRQFFIAGDKKLIGEEDKEIRLLLLGIGGPGHDGATLTDTMILATLKLPQDKYEKIQVSLISIPRDLVVYLPRSNEYRKINSAYAYGELDGKKQGAAWTLEATEQVLGVDIPYYGVIDFAGFKKIVDDLGGIEINVGQGFTDSLYPDEKGGYLLPVTFDPGVQKMDGTRALQFVRSRHGNNNQGSDFARARRQQQVLKAIKDKATGFRVLTNLGLIDRLLDDLSNHIRTNLEPYQLKRLFVLSRGLDNKNIHSLTIDHESGLVCDEIVQDTGAFILIPCAGLGKYDAIQNFLRNQFLLAKLVAEKPLIEIQNASNIGSLGQKAEAALKSPFLQISVSNFKGPMIYEASIIYDNTKGRKPHTLDYLKQKLGLHVAQSPFPFSTTSPNPDFVIVVTIDLEDKLP